MQQIDKDTAFSFDNLTIVPKLLGLLKELGYITPTPIQHKAIPHAIQGKDVLGIAQTGTGKTLAFAVPLIQRISETKGRGLIIVPTRELALQVNETFEKLGKKIGLKTAVLIGGMAMPLQLRMLSHKPHVIVATPGRLIDHLERKSVSLSTINTLILDEADLMLDMGFAPQINRILQEVPSERQTMLFSATMPREIEKIAASYMKSPIRIEMSPAGSPPDRIHQQMEYVRKEEKTDALHSLLQINEGSAIVFVRTKFGARKLFYELKKLNYSAAEIHSDRSLAQRRSALDGFKSGKNRVLVATDIAARGIDVSGIGLVVNYDLPENPEDYVHRIGRTGRAGKKGHAVSLAVDTQRSMVRRIERLVNIKFAASQLDRSTFARRESTPRSEATVRSYEGPKRGEKKKTNYSTSFGRSQSSARRESTPQRSEKKEVRVSYFKKRSSHR